MRREETAEAVRVVMRMNVERRRRRRERPKRDGWIRLRVM